MCSYMVNDKSTVSLIKFTLKLLTFISLSLLTVNARTSDVLKVKLSHGGVLVGRHLTSHNGHNVRAFMGIPYAKPPLGDLRFKSPVPYGSWSGEKQATHDSPICIQRDPFYRDKEITGSEDCLYLNVFTPEISKESKPFPVMVWFHGGGWQSGSGVSTFYGPDFLMDHKIIYVSGNYRLGPLGFLSTETLDCPGNFGLKDQLEILKWVQQNIEAFGGDPKSVTIFGESAGGASVTYHMASQKSKGLFHKGIVQSGAYFDPWAQPAHKGIAVARAIKTAKLVGCEVSKDWKKTLKCLRSKPAKHITEVLYKLFEWDTDPMIPFPPVVEPPSPDAFLTNLPRNELVPHGFSLPLMIGVTSEEGALKTASLLNLPGLLDEFKAKFSKILPIILYYNHHSKATQDKISRQIESFYFKNGHNYDRRNHHNLTDLMSDGWFVAGIDEYLRLRLNDKTQKKTKVGPTFVYLFDHKGAASFTEILSGGNQEYYGVCHADELQYLFPIGKSKFMSAVPTQEDVKIRKTLTSMWVNFAKTNNPTPPESHLPNWKPAKTYPVDFVRIGTQNPNDWQLLSSEKGLLQDRVDFWKILVPHVPADQYRDEL